MSLSAAIFILIVLIIVSAILSSAEISLAGARRIKLQTLANEGNINAENTQDKIGWLGVTSPLISFTETALRYSSNIVIRQP